MSDRVTAHDALIVGDITRTEGYGHMREEVPDLDGIVTALFEGVGWNPYSGEPPPVLALVPDPDRDWGAIERERQRRVDENGGCQHGLDFSLSNDRGIAEGTTVHPFWREDQDEEA